MSVFPFYRWGPERLTCPRSLKRVHRFPRVWLPFSVLHIHQLVLPVNYQLLPHTIRQQKNILRVVCAAHTVLVYRSWKSFLHVQFSPWHCIVAFVGCSRLQKPLLGATVIYLAALPRSGQKACIYSMTLLAAVGFKLLVYRVSGPL